MAEPKPADAATPNGVQAAAAYLRELLLRPGRYRRTWEQYAERSRLGQVNQLAVAEVLAHYLREHPRAQGDVEVRPRQLKDTASRALSGKLLSKATLGLFTDAFDLGAFERERLLKLWEGSAHVRVLSGPRAIREDQAVALGRPQIKTLSLHDHHYLGPDGRPERHRVIHVVEALTDGVDRVPYRADTNALTVEVGQGFSGLAGPFYQPLAELFVVDMLLAEPLAAGETATLEYSTSFHYTAAPPPEFRRVVQSFVENLDIRVEFHPGKLPGDVVWAIWDGMDGPIAESEHVTLDSQFAVHRYLRLAEQTTVGFHWDWLPSRRDANGPYAFAFDLVTRQPGTKFVNAGIREVSMRRISRTVFGVLASASLLGGIGGAALAVLTTATSGSAGAVAAVRVPNPTAVEYGVTAIEY